MSPSCFYLFVACASVTARAIFFSRHPGAFWDGILIGFHLTPATGGEFPDFVEAALGFGLLPFRLVRKTEVLVDSCASRIDVEGLPEHADRSEEHTSELQSHSFISYA